MADAQAKLADADALPSARVLQAVTAEHASSFVSFVRERSHLTQDHLLALPWSAEQQAKFDAMAAASVEEQKKIEASDSLPFDIYLQRYTSAERLGRPSAQAA